MQNLEKIQSLIDSSEYEQAANLFLELTKTELSVVFKRFGPMPWDKDGQKRNIFEFTLKRGKKTYKSEFGASIADSCKLVSKIDTADVFEIFFGWSVPKLGKAGRHYITTTINATRQELKNGKLFSQNLERVKGELMAKATKAVEEHNEIARRNHDKDDVKRLFGLNWMDMLEGRLWREHSRLINKKTYSKDEQAKIEKPTNYDILSCLSIDYFQDVDDVVDTFGEMNPSQAIAIFKQDAKLRAFFTDEEERQMLNSIV